MKFLIEKRLTFTLFFAALILLGVVVLFYYNTRKVKSTSSLVQHTQEVLRKSDYVLVDILNIENGLKGFILTENEVFLENYQKSVNTINININDLLLLCKDNTRQKLRIDSLKTFVARRLIVSKNTIELIKQYKIAEIEKIETIEQGKILTDKIRFIISEINKEEFKLLKQRRTENELTSDYSLIILLLLVIFIVIIFGLVFYIIKTQRIRNTELEEHTASQLLLSNYSLSLIEASLDPLVTINTEGKITDMNEALANITGHARAELTGTDFFTYFTEAQKAREVYQQVFAKESVADMPLTIRHKDGKLTDVLFNGSVYRDANGEVLGIVIVARDIAEQKWARELRDANKELAFQNEVKEKRAAELIIANEELAFQNEEKGKRAAELILANKELLFQNEEKEKRAAELIIANEELVFQSEEKVKRAAELIMADKEIVFQISEKEKQESVNIELEAISNSLKLASQYSLSLIEASLDPLITISPEGKITDMNEALVNITGITRDKLTGTDFFDYFTEPQKAREVYQEVFAKGSVADLPLILRHKDGKLTDVLFNGSVYRDLEGNVLGIVIVARDVAEQKWAMELRNVNKELAFQNEEKEKRATELGIANQELAFQNEVKEKRAAELIVANAELAFQNEEKEKRAAELLIANAELAFQNEEKEKRAAELIIANEELVFQSEEKVKRAAELIMADKEIVFQISEKEKQAAANLELEAISESLKLASQYSLSLIEASLDPLVTISPEGKITDMNEALVNVTGIAREKLTGTDFFDYFTEPQKAREVYQEVFAKGSVADSPLTLRSKNGKLIDVLFNGSVYKDDHGNVLGIVIVARDVTAQKLLSNYSLSLIEASRDPLFTINPEGKITDMNVATVHVTGVTREELIGTDFFNYFTDSDKARQCYQQAFAHEFIVDFPLTITDGELTDVLCNGSVYKDDRGNVLGVVIVARDITEQKRLTTELTEAIVFAELATEFAENAKKKAESATMTAENAVKSKQQFLSNMSHEIRTPMNAIIGFTKVVLKTDLTAKQKEYLNAIKLSGDALIVLINDILDLAKVDAGKMVFELVPFKMAASLSAMLHLFETKIREKNIALVKEYDKNIPEVLLGDPVRLHQIILNLVSNAVKFTNNGRITVNVHLLSEDDEKANIEFSVSDTGIGIKQDKLEKIFENFQQASSGTSRLYGGTGLGLAIVKQLVEAQGGTIHVTSKLNVGSTFSFILGFPKTKVGAATGLDIVKLDKEVRNIKVLVAEDIALNQLLMRTLLDDFGFECEIAGNGQIAVEKLQAESYDIVLMDLQMPEMNGFEATDYIRNRMNSDIPIIALTADVTTVDLAKCKSVGMNDYIAKPVDEKLLYNKIVDLVNNASLIDGYKESEIVGSKISKCIDLDYLKRRTKSNPALMMEMISLYLEQTPVLINAMKKSMQEKDWKSLYLAVHKLIPSFSIMGISTDYENMAKQVQEYASTQEQTEGIPFLVLQIESVCTQACNELEAELITLKKQTHE